MDTSTALDKNTTDTTQAVGNANTDSCLLYGGVNVDNIMSMPTTYFDSSVDNDDMNASLYLRCKYYNPCTKSGGENYIFPVLLIAGVELIVAIITALMPDINGFWPTALVLIVLAPVLSVPVFTVMALHSDSKSRSIYNVECTDFDQFMPHEAYPCDLVNLQQHIRPFPTDDFNYALTHATDGDYDQLVRDFSVLWSTEEALEDNPSAVTQDVLTRSRRLVNSIAEKGRQLSASQADEELIAIDVLTHA